jgi:hypothetical protein
MYRGMSGMGMPGMPMGMPMETGLGPGMMESRMGPQMPEEEMPVKKKKPIRKKKTTGKKAKKK